jgi:hypothetical protein
MLPDAHACDVVSCPAHRWVPDVDADQIEMAVMVSDVPPLVHWGSEPMEAAPPEALPNVTDCRAVEPAETLAVPALPGSPVCSWM